MAGADEGVWEQDIWTPKQAALFLRVDPKTLARWAREGKLKYVKTLGGHRRYPEKEIRRIKEIMETGFTRAGKAAS
jgi:excisionase family DNA binding protein